MISDRDIWAAAPLMVKRYKVDAMQEAAARADQLLEDGDPAGAGIWHRILDAIERLQAKSPAEGGMCTELGSYGLRMSVILSINSSGVNTL